MNTKSVKLNRMCFRREIVVLKRHVTWNHDTIFREGELTVVVVVQGTVRTTVVGVAAQAVHILVVTVIPGGGTLADDAPVGFPCTLEVLVGQYVTV